MSKHYIYQNTAEKTALAIADFAATHDVDCAIMYKRDGKWMAEIFYKEAQAVTVNEADNVSLLGEYVVGLA